MVLHIQALKAMSESRHISCGIVHAIVLMPSLSTGSVLVGIHGVTSAVVGVRAVVAGILGISHSCHYSSLEVSTSPDNTRSISHATVVIVSIWFGHAKVLVGSEKVTRMIVGGTSMGADALLVKQDAMNSLTAVVV